MPKSLLLPINDSQRPICRHYIKNMCWRGDCCRFYHPPSITPPVRLEISRQRGKCYCGNSLSVIPNRRNVTEENVGEPNFFVVCSKTKRSIKGCR